MKKLIYTLLILSVPALTFAGNSEFSYDKAALSNEFSQLDKVVSYVEKTDVTYSELSKSPVFEGNLQLTDHIAIQPNFSFDDMDWKAFAWGFCCWPIGAFIYLLPSKDKSQEEKTSFFIGFLTGVVLGAIGGIGGGA